MVALAAVAGLLVGAVITLMGPFEYSCTTTMRITGRASKDHVAVCRKELLDYALVQGADTTGARAAFGGWLIDSPEPSLLRLTLRTSDRRAGVALVRRIAQGFRERMRGLAADARETPTRAEELLAGRATELRERQAQAQAQIDAVMATIPDTDPAAHHDALAERWEQLRSDFSTSREELSRTSADVNRLRAEPEPTHGLVSAEQREQALQSDAALQQDLSELAVNLTEVKLHLSNVWQRSAGPLERIALRVHDLIETASSGSGRTNFGQGATRLQTLIGSTEAYRDMVETFRRVWTREFNAVRRLNIDPYNGETLDRYERVRRTLNDFLFAAARRLASIRSQVHAIADDPQDGARHHVFQSSLMRAFHAMQTAHHRFEFAAGTIETPDNFRLDAALKAARGLRRRSRDCIRQIEEQLQAEAALRARQRQSRKLAGAEKHVRHLRAVTDRALGELIAMQDDLNVSAKQAETFLRAVLRIETVAARLELARNDLVQTEVQLDELVAERNVAANGTDVEIVSSGVVGGPGNLIERLGLGALGGALTLLSVLLGQWWITRRA